MNLYDVYFIGYEWKEIDIKELLRELIIMNTTFTTETTIPVIN